MNTKQKTVIAGMAGNFLLASAKTGLSILSGSAALIADALHSFSDLLVSLLVLAGMKVNRKKIEALVTFVVGILIISVAVGFVLELFFREQPLIRHIGWTVTGQIFLIIATYILYKYKTVIGIEEKSESLVADGAHTKSDMFSSIGVLFSLIGSLIGLNIDKAVAFIIFFLILYQGLETILNALYLFSDREKFHWDLKKITEKLIQYSKDRRKKVTILLTAILLLIYIFPGFYIIKHNQSGIRTVLGVLESEILKPGLHFDPLHPFSSIEKIATSEIQTMEYGFSFKSDSSDDIVINQMETVQHSQKYFLNSREDELVTGDGSITKMYLIIEYRINNPYNYLSVSDTPLKILNLETGSILQKITGSLGLFDVLNNKRAYIEDELRKRLNFSMEKFQTGMFVENINIFSISPHLETIYMFRKVQDEEQYKETLLYDAEALKSKQIPYYRGLAYEKIINAEAAANEIVLKAERESAYYKMIEKEYERNKEAVVYRLGLDSRVRLLKNSEKILIDDSLKENQIRLNYESRAQ